MASVFGVYAARCRKRGQNQNRKKRITNKEIECLCITIGLHDYCSVWLVCLLLFFFPEFHHQYFFRAIVNNSFMLATTERASSTNPADTMALEKSCLASNWASSESPSLVIRCNLAIIGCLNTHNKPISTENSRVIIFIQVKYPGLISSCGWSSWYRCSSGMVWNWVRTKWRAAPISSTVTTQGWDSSLCVTLTR